MGSFKSNQQNRILKMPQMQVRSGSKDYSCLQLIMQQNNRLRMVIKDCYHKRIKDCYHRLITRLASSKMAAWDYCHRTIKDYFYLQLIMQQNNRLRMVISYHQRIKDCYHQRIKDRYHRLITRLASSKMAAWA